MKAKRSWRTRKDEFAEVWPVIREQISTNLGLEAKTTFVNHVHEFNRRDDASGVVERLKDKHRLQAKLDPPTILFDVLFRY